MSTTLGALLLDVTAALDGTALFAPPDAAFGADMPVLVWDVDDVEPGKEDPAAAEALGYEYVLLTQDIASIVANARMQRPDASLDDLLDALAHYYANDVFVVWPRTGEAGSDQVTLADET